MREFLAQTLPDTFGVSGKFSAAAIIHRARDFAGKFSPLYNSEQMIFRIIGHIFRCNVEGGKFEIRQLWLSDLRETFDM